MQICHFLETTLVDLQNRKKRQPPSQQNTISRQNIKKQAFYSLHNLFTASVAGAKQEAFILHVTSHRL